MPDTAHDALQHDDPLVSADGVASYAGVPLTTPEGLVIGAHCVLGISAHDFDETGIALLEVAADEAVGILEEYRRRG